MKSINFIYHEFTFTHSFSVQDDGGVRSVSGWFHFSFQTLTYKLITEKITKKDVLITIYIISYVCIEVIYIEISVYSSHYISSVPIRPLKM